jgi:plastocyanin
LSKVLRPWPWYAGVGVALVLLSSRVAVSEPPARPTAVSVTIENMQFVPATLSVRRGDRIVWVNKDLFPHTVTATNKAFDSGSIAAGGSWTYLADKSGQYSYGCVYHPTMKGALKVQ